MEITNYTEDTEQKSFQQVYCLEASTGEIHHQLTSLSVINILLSITAFLGNVLILVALNKETTLHPPSKILLHSLATTDLFVGLISEPVYVVYLMSVVNERWEICTYAFASAFIAGYLLGSVSILTLTAISVDRLLALLLGLRYRQVVTSNRTSVTVVTLWAVSVLASVMYFWNHLITLWYSYVVIPLCLVISITSYTKIFYTLRHIRNPIQNEQQNQAIPLNIARYRKAVSSVLWVQLTLLACYLPFVIDGIVGRVLSTQNELSSSAFLVKVCTNTLVYLNSSLNPILYCWKIEEVRQAVKATIRQVLCCS
ncbi:adenosine receptor A3-like [Oculina patagonica]